MGRKGTGLERIGSKTAREGVGQFFAGWVHGSTLPVTGAVNTMHLPRRKECRRWDAFQLRHLQRSGLHAKHRVFRLAGWSAGTSMSACSSVSWPLPPPAALLPLPLRLGAGWLPQLRRALAHALLPQRVHLGGRGGALLAVPGPLPALRLLC